MSYEENRLKYYLDRNSLIQVYSKTTSSVYYYFKTFSIRYSDHYTTSPGRIQQYQIIRTARKVMILEPGRKEYIVKTEKTGLYFLRKLVKEDRLRKDYRDTKYIRFMKNKKRIKEKRLLRKTLLELRGQNLKSLYMDQTSIGI